MLGVYRANVTAPGTATAMLNWYRAAGRDIMAATDLDAPVDTPTLVIWGEEDIALGLACLDGTDRYVRDLGIERLRDRIGDRREWVPGVTRRAHLARLPSRTTIGCRVSVSVHILVVLRQYKRVFLTSVRKYWRNRRIFPGTSRTQ